MPRVIYFDPVVIGALLLVITFSGGELNSDRHFDHFWKLFSIVSVSVDAQNELSLPLATDELQQPPQPQQQSQPSLSQVGPSVPPMSSVPMSAGDNKATLYLGTFQILAMPFGADNLPGFNGAPSTLPGGLATPK